MVPRRATNEYRGCVGGVMVMSWRCRGDVLTKSWWWYSALQRAYKRWNDFTRNHIPCKLLVTCYLCYLLFVSEWDQEWREKIEHAVECLSPYHRRCSGRQRASAINHSNHRRYYHIDYVGLQCRCWHQHVGNSAVVSPMCCDIFNLCVPHRMFADCCALLSDISPMVLGHETSGENFNACIEFFGDVPMPWWSMTITRRRRWSFAELLAHGGAALAMPKFEHRDSIGKLKRPV